VEILALLVLAAEVEVVADEDGEEVVAGTEGKNQYGPCIKSYTHTGFGSGRGRELSLGPGFFLSDRRPFCCTRCPICTFLTET
jgi:hypothetical protein